MGIATGKTSPCPACRANGRDRTGDNLVHYRDGSAHCHACGYDEQPNKPTRHEELEGMIQFSDVARLPHRALDLRRISEEVAKQYGVRCELNPETGEPEAFYFPLYRGGSIAAYQRKVARKPGQREKGDVRRVYGDPVQKSTGCLPFGSQLAGTGKGMLVVTEGGEDCMAARMLLDAKGKNYRVVGSLGADAWQQCLEFYESFDKVLIAFDQDGAGKASSNKFANALTPGKGFIMSWPERWSDPNQLLGNRAGADIFLDALNKAAAPQTGGIIHGEAAWLAIESYTEPEYIPYPPEFEHLNAKLKGMRRGEISLWTSGTGCVSAATEYLTPTGWRRIDMYTGGLVGQWDEDGRVTFVQPERYVVEPATHLNHIATKYGVDMVLCDDHRVIYTTEKGGLYHDYMSNVKVSHANNVTGWRGRIPTTFKLETKGLPLTDAEVRVHVMVSADGYIDPRRGTTHVNVKKPRKIERARELLRAAGIVWSERIGAPGYVRFVFRHTSGKGYSSEWYQASDAQRAVILEEVVKWDGNQSNRFYSTVKDQADYIQWVAHSQGVRASMQIVPRPDKGHTEYNLCFSHHTEVSFRKGAGAKPEIRCVPTTDGKKYCFTVPSGMLVLRHNGHIFVTGNCGKSAFIRRIKQHVIQNTDWRLGDVELEETKEKTIRAMLQYQGAKPLRDMSPQEKRAAWQATYGTERLFTVDRRSRLHKGVPLLSQLKHLRYGLGVDIITLDHITLAQDELGDGKEGIAAQDKMMADLLELVESTGVHICLISHLRKATGGGKSFEEGAMPTLDDLKGSGSVKQISMDIVALGRNLQDPNPYMQNVTQLRVLKNREDGNVGDADALFFDKSTYSFTQSNPPSFEEDDDDGSPRQF